MTEWQPVDGGQTPPMFDNPRAEYTRALGRQIAAGAVRCPMRGPYWAGAVPGCELVADHDGPHAFLIEWTK